MKTVLLFGHGGYYNRGCEAIVRSTVKLLRARLGDVRVILASYDRVRDTERGLQLVDLMIPHQSPRWSSGWAVARARDLVKRGTGATWWAAPIRSVLPHVDIMLSIGGDNYCYAEPDYYFFVDELFRKAGIPTVLWGASVHVDGASAAKLGDLKAFSLITARESLTVENLKGAGIYTNVVHVADPAFTMDTEPVDTDSFWPEGNGVLGFNISPLLDWYRAADGSRGLLEASVQAIQHAVDNLGMGVLLIPHVTEPMAASGSWNDDAKLLRRVLTEVARPGRVSLMPSTFNAAQSKHIISRCRMFIGARTHATIAALSTCVPTISIGYSVKARGINLDVFGTDDYVCDIKNLSEATLKVGLGKLVTRELAIKDHLQKTIPHIRSRAVTGVEYLAQLMGL